MKTQAGFALLAVMLVLTLLAVVVTEFAFSARLEASMVRAYRDGVLASHLAEAGVEQAIREILSQAQIAAPDQDGQLIFYRALPGQTTPARLPALPRTRVGLGSGEFSYRITDEAGRLSVNGPAVRIDRLLAALGLDQPQRDIIRDSLEDWRDANEIRRLNGAESDFYLRLALPYRARNSNVQDTAELLQIRGITRELYFGTAERPGLHDLVSAVGLSTVNVNSAAAPVLKALGLSDAEVANVIETRARVPYTAVPGPLAGRGLTVASATFRIEAVGVAGGMPRSRVVAVVQRGGPQGPLGVRILSWRPGSAE